ncbi:MAG: hypothetical protein ACD_79C01103G0002 [uncultured bacterium]|nr:MAG: hypothetical protein ACD_79C01103G0002 [uncultured bacterium]
MRKNFNKKSGFTLIELLVVLAIIAILMSIIIPKIGDARAKAQRVSCASNMRNIVRAMQMYEEDFNASCVYDEDNNRANGVGNANTVDETTKEIFGRLYYNKTDPKTGDPKMGLTTLKIYNCPSSASAPPSPNAGGYQLPLVLTANSQEHIDYGIVITGNYPSHRMDPDKNAILIENALNHSGRNIAFWDSTIKFCAKTAVVSDYPDNVSVKDSLITGATEKAGQTIATKIYTAGEVLTETGINTAGDLAADIK